MFEFLRLGRATEELTTIDGLLFLYLFVGFVLFIASIFTAVFGYYLLAIGFIALMIFSLGMFVWKSPEADFQKGKYQIKMRHKWIP